MSLGGFAASAIVVPLLFVYLPAGALSTWVALALASAGVLATIVLELPPFFRVLRGAPLPRGPVYKGNAMKQRELQETLARLHEELRNGQHLDDEARGMLERLAGDIEQALHPASADSVDALDALGQRLREAIERFEESHPALTAAVNRVADALARMGI